MTGKWRICLCALFAAACSRPNEEPLRFPHIILPNSPGAVRFAAIGDNGTGEKPEYDVGVQMARAHQQFAFTTVLMLGDNIYGEKDYELKFERPYGALLSAGVEFHATLGNHDSPSEISYAPFHMGGQRYYTFTTGNVQFFALDSIDMDPVQRSWISEELARSRALWKICFFHYPLYSDARYHGPDVALRTELEPIFEKYGVNLVLSGHEHVYERLKPQHGISYFIEGSSGQLRAHDLRPNAPDEARGFDADRAFMLFEIDARQLYFETIARSGTTVDSGELQIP